MTAVIQAGSIEAIRQEVIAAWGGQHTAGIEAVAAYLAVHHSTVRRIIACGDLRAWRTSRGPRGELRVRAGELARYLWHREHGRVR